MIPTLAAVIFISSVLAWLSMRQIRADIAREEAEQRLRDLLH